VCACAVDAINGLEKCKTNIHEAVEYGSSVDGGSEVVR